MALLLQQLQQLQPQPAGGCVPARIASIMQFNCMCLTVQGDRNSSNPVLHEDVFLLATAPHIDL
jgi:hypothetical protein